MIKIFLRLLDNNRVVLHRYIRFVLCYGLCCGLTITTLLPVSGHLLHGDMSLTVLWLVILLTAVLICWYLRRKTEKAGIAVGISLLQGGRHQLGDHVARLPTGWFTAQNTAQLNHIATQGMMEIAQLPAHVLTPLCTGIITPVVIMIALFSLNWQMGLIALLVFPVLSGVFLFTARSGQRMDDNFHRHSANTSQRMIEFAQSQSVLRAFNGEEGGIRFLKQAISQQQKSAGRQIRLSAMSLLVNTAAVQVCFAILLVTATLWLDHLLKTDVETSSIIAAIVSLLLVSRFIDPLLDVAGYSEVLRGVRSQLKAAQKIFAVQPLEQPQNPQSPADSSVELRGVSFRYDADQTDVLQNVSLRIEPGSMIALAGASGSGKTTLLRLIARFFDVNQGSIRIGGVDIRQISDIRLAAQLSQIFQDAYLFQGSIADNIRVGKPDASDDEVMEAAKKAGVIEMIDRLPHGLDTQAGEGGVRLSGGERQRISVARALIKNAPILLIDEATAALDAENQLTITETLHRLRGKHTLIVIAHQLSTVKMADHILVLDHGKIKEQGTHSQLSQMQGLYAHFLEQRRQAKGWHITGTYRDRSC